ncbi:MAG: hypothetical protein FLDDKLPJ_02535 [Phycisphaerae bacterium]|nr:hypothetical protein [Phycisphaerae bacterium]
MRNAECRMLKGESCPHEGMRRSGSVHAITARSSAKVRGAFTLVEILVVVAIIVILLVSVVTLGGWAVRKGQSKNTEGMLRIVADALEQFAADAPLAAVKQPGGAGQVAYVSRYGKYPADELEVYGSGIPGSTQGRSLAPGGGVVVPDAGGGYQRMTFVLGGAAPQFENRDIATMLLAIELHSESAAQILSRVSEKHLVAVPLDGAGDPVQYLDRDRDGKYNPKDDEPLRWLVDDWQVPVTYFSQRDFRDGAAESSNHPQADGWSWNEVSTRLVKMNGGAPVLMSWGPDGKDQRTEVNQTGATAANIATDLLGLDGSAKDRIDNPLNADNVYANPALAEKLAGGK